MYQVDMSTILDESIAIEALGALAQQTRLKVFQSLMAIYPERSPAGAIAEACGVPHNTMSTHLAILTRAKLIRSERESRSIFYSANLDGFRQLVSFLTQDCCHGRPELCATLVAPFALPLTTAADPCCPPEKPHG